MSIFYSHQVPSSRTIAERLRPLLQTAGRAILAALRTMHCSIVAAKQRRLARELMLHDLGEHPGASPRAPLILGDKWDF